MSEHRDMNDLTDVLIKVFPNTDQRVGAATVLRWLRDLIASSPRDQLPKAELLALLEALSRDPFPRQDARHGG